MTRWSMVKPGVWETAGGRWRIARQQDGRWRVTRGSDAWLPMKELHDTLTAAKVAVAEYRATVLAERGR